MLSKGADLPRPPPTHPEETEEELTETNDMQDDDAGVDLKRSVRVIHPVFRHKQPNIIVCPFRPIRLQKEGSDDSMSHSERRGVYVKGEDDSGVVHVKGESTESELDEEEEEDDVIQLGSGDEDGRGSYTQVGE